VVGEYSYTFCLSFRFPVIGLVVVIASILAILASIGQLCNSTLVLTSSGLVNDNRVSHNSARHLCKVLNGSVVVSRQCNIALRRAVLFRHNSLCGHNRRASLCNNRFLASLVNVASQSRNQQSGQDCQDDQNDYKLYKGEALFVFQFF